MISWNLEDHASKTLALNLKVNIILERKMNARNKHNCRYVSKNEI